MQIRSTSGAIGLVKKVQSTTMQANVDNNSDQVRQMCSFSSAFPAASWKRIAEALVLLTCISHLREHHNSLDFVSVSCTT